MSAQRITRRSTNPRIVLLCWKTKLTGNAQMYISHLHPDNTYLWQKPNLNPKNRTLEIWYTTWHLGKMPLGHFIAEISEKVGTSKPYPNHYVRVSTTNIITNCGLFNDKEVMDFTGHKSVQIVQIYR